MQNFHANQSDLQNVETANRFRFILPAIKGGSDHPFVEISESIYILARLAIALNVVAICILGLSGPILSGLYVVRLLLAIMALLLSTLPLWMRIKEVGLFHPLFLTSGLTFAKGSFSGIAFNAYGISLHPALPNVRGFELDLLQIKVLLLSILATSCIYLVFFNSKGIKWKSLGFRKRKGLLLVASIAGLVIGSASLFFLVEASGGLSDHLKNINVGIKGKVWVKYYDYISIFSQLARLIILAPAIWVLAGKRPFSNPLFWVLAIFALAAAFLVNGRRSSILLAGMVLVACWILRRGSLAIGRLAIVGVLMFLMIGLVGEFRRSNWGNRQGVNFDAVQNTDLQLMIKISSEELALRQNAKAIYPIVAKVPKSVPYRYGSIYFSYLYRFIPRSIWKDKPEGGIGHDCAQIFYGRGLGVGVPPGAIGEAYWSFGFLGVIFVFSFWGWCLRSMANFFKRFRPSPFANIIYLATVVILTPSETGFRAWLYLIVPLVGILFLMGAMRFTDSAQGHGR